MLGRVLSQVPSGKDEGKNREAELHTLHIQTGGITTSTKEDSRGGESKVSSPRGKKRAASEDLEMGAPRQGKKALPRGPAPKGVLTAPCPPTGPPSAKLYDNRKYEGTPSFSENNNQDPFFAVRLASLLDRVRLRGISLRR